MRSFLTALVDAWPRLAGAPLGLARPRLMKASSRPGANLPLVFFLFEEGAGEPAYVLKVNRNVAWPDGILREYRNYSAIYTRVADAGLRIPRPLFCDHVDAHVVLCETYVPGHRLEDRFFSSRVGWWRRRALEGFLDKAMGWAREFHRRTLVDTRVIDAECLAADFETQLARVRQRADVSAPLRDGLVRFERTLERLRGRAWPVTAVHGDFDHGNVLVEGDKLGVVDWEDCEPAGDPFVDLAYLIFDLALVSDLGVARERRLAAFFAPGGWTDGIVRALVRDHARALGADPDLFFLTLPRTVSALLTRDWGPGRDPRSIPLCSPDMLEFTLALSGRMNGAHA